MCADSITGVYDALSGLPGLDGMDFVLAREKGPDGAEWMITDTATGRTFRSPDAGELIKQAACFYNPKKEKP